MLLVLFSSLLRSLIMAVLVAQSDLLSFFLFLVGYIDNTIGGLSLFKLFYYSSALNLLSSLIHQSARSIANLCFRILWLFLYCTISSIQLISCLSIRCICCCLGRFFTLESPLFLGYNSNTIEIILLFKLYLLFFLFFSLPCDFKLY